MEKVVSKGVVLVMYSYEEDIEQIFNSDCRDKKIIGRGIHCRAKRLRKHETLVMPTDRIANKLEKRLITAPSVVKIYNLKELAFMTLLEKVQSGEVPSREEIDALSQTSFEDAQTIVAELLRIHTGTKLQKDLNLKGWHDWKKWTLDKYKVYKAGGGEIFTGQKALELANKKKKKKEENSIAIIKPTAPITTTVRGGRDTEPQIVHTPAVTVIPSETFAVKIDQNYNVKQLTSLLERLSMFLDNPDVKEYNVQLIVREIG